MLSKLSLTTLIMTFFVNIAVAEIVNFNGIILNIPNGFQVASGGVSSQQNNVKNYLNQQTSEQLLLMHSQLSSNEVSDFLNETKLNWPQNGEAFAVSMGKGLASATYSSNGMLCDYKGFALNKKSNYEFSVKVTLLCSHQNNTYTAVFFAAPILTSTGIDTIRMQCAVNTNDSCKDKFLNLWNNVTIK